MVSPETSSGFREMLKNGQPKLKLMSAPRSQAISESKDQNFWL